MHALNDLKTEDDSNFRMKEEVGEESLIKEVDKIIRIFRRG